MARPIVVEFAANVREFLRGSRDVQRSTEDIADELKDATRDAERFEREFQDSMRDAEREAERTSRSVERDFDRMGDGMGEVGREAGEEFKQNLGESVASGDVESIVQDTLGGLVGSLSGPIGLAAAGIAGVIGFAFVKMREQAEEEKQRIEELMGSLSDSIAGLYEQGIKNASRVEELQAFTDWTDENGPNIEKMAESAGEFSGNIEDVVAAAYRGGDVWEAQSGVLLDHVSRMREIYGVQSDQYKKAVDLAQQASDLNETRKEEEQRQGRINDATQTYAELLGLADTNADGVIDDLDAVNAETGEAVGKAQEYADNVRTWESPILAARDGLLSMEEAVRRLTEKRHTAWIEFQVTGNGASYLNPRDSNYSPGHVAIDNMHTKGSG